MIKVCHVHMCCLHYSAFTLGCMALNKFFHIRLKMLLATLFNESVHTSHMSLHI